MGRRPKHPSGPGVNVVLRLAPEYVEILDHLARRHGGNRSATVAAVLAQVVDDAAKERADRREMKAITDRIGRAMALRRCTRYTDGAHVLLPDGTCKGCGVRLER